MQAAAREAAEEAGLRRPTLRVVGEHVDDHGGWSYTTVVGQRRRAFHAHRCSPRSRIAVRLGARRAVQSTLPLHPGFAATWDAVRAIA